MYAKPTALDYVAEQPARTLTNQHRRVIIGAALGSVFEWYDFFLYGALAAIIAAQFFARADPATGLIFALLAFSAGFIVRPFGAIVFGHIGDRIGRKIDLPCHDPADGRCHFSGGLTAG